MNGACARFTHNKFVSESRYHSPKIGWHRTLALPVIRQKKKIIHASSQTTPAPKTRVSSAPATKNLPATTQPPRLLCSPWSLAHPTCACNANPSCFSDGLPQPQQSQHAFPHADPYERCRQDCILVLQCTTRPSPGTGRVRRRHIGGARMKPTMDLFVATHHHHHHPPAQKQRER